VATGSCTGINFMYQLAVGSSWKFFRKCIFRPEICH